jgi:dTDP-glucose pyrophosphorylase
MSGDSTLERCKVHATGTLWDAMSAIDRGGAAIALVVDDDGRLVGVMTDGDVRRALLAGRTLQDALAPAAHRSFTAVGGDVGRAAILELMQARGVAQVPVLDGEGRLIGLHTLHAMLGYRERPHWAVVMAGGLGSRLRPLTETVPKPMLRVAGRPILERIVLHLTSHGVRRIFIAVNYLGHLIEEHFGDGARFGCRIEYLREKAPLGTGGAIGLLPETPSTSMLVMNGDLVTQADLGALLDRHDASGASATLAVRRYFHQVPFGVVDIADGSVSGISEKPRISLMVNAGIYALSPQAIARIPRDTATTMPALLDRLLADGERVVPFEITEDWIDVGQRQQFEEAAGVRLEHV